MAPPKGKARGNASNVNRGRSGARRDDDEGLALQLEREGAGSGIEDVSGNRDDGRRDEDDEDEEDEDNANVGNANTPVQDENNGSRSGTLPPGPLHEAARDVRTTPFVPEGLGAQPIYMAYNPNTRKQPPTFSSKKRDWILASAWIQQHQRWHTLNGVAAPNRTMVSTQYLDGPSLVWYNDMPERFHTYTDTWDDFVQAFRSRWYELNWEEQALNKFNAIKQTTDVDEYTTAFQQAYSTIKNRVDEFVAIHRFIDGLKPKTKIDVRRQAPKTLNEAMEFAAFAEPVNAATVESKRLRFMNRTKQKAGTADTRTCYSCKKTGHIARNCPDKASSSNTGNSSSSGQGQSQSQENGQPRRS